MARYRGRFTFFKPVIKVAVCGILRFYFSDIYVAFIFNSTKIYDLMTSFHDFLEHNCVTAANEIQDS